MADAWNALVLTLPDGLADEVGAEIAGGRLGVRFEEAAPGRTRVHVYLRESDPGALAAAAEVLRRRDLDPRACGLREERVEDGRWVERYQASLRPFDLGRSFTVLPSGDGRAGEGRRALRLVPGRAFGTGEHPTTRGCVEQLESRVVAGSRWLDLGCGTGILSLVAHLAGAGSVTGCDLDPVAVEVARETSAANGSPPNVGFVVGSAESPPAGGPWDGVVCNIAVSFFLGYHAELAALVGPGGWLVASGFLVEDVSAVVDRLAPHGLREVERVDRAPWAILVARRQDPA